MTDQDIIHLAFEYMECMDGCICFKDEQLIEFARALLEIKPAADR
jgi:hypothetical protein